jgi:flagellar biosynthesis/type III secretory pathway protein FliH
MATESARRFEPSTPLRERALGFEPASITGHCFSPEGASSSAAPGSTPPTPAEIEALQREAFERGVAEGRAALPWQEAAELQRALAALEQAARGLIGLRRGYLVENRKAVIELACSIVQQIAGASLAVRGEVLDALLDRALCAAALGEAPIEVRVALADLATLEAARAGRSDHSLRFEVDPQLPAGEARIATRTGDVRASLEVAIEQLRQGLDEALTAPEPATEASA